jgi:hypothetical protein
MLLARFSRMLLARRLNAIVARCHELIDTLSHPYRPELYYMRGPGPKWRAKHQFTSRNGM